MLRPALPIGLLLLGPLWVQGAAAGAPPDPSAATSAPAAQLAAVAPASAPLNARTLGLGEALLDYCTQNDPASAAKVRAQLQRLVQGVSKEALAAVRKSAEYLTARNSERSFVSKVDPHNAHRVCSGWTDVARAQSK